MKIHYRMMIEMTPVGQSFLLKSSKGEQINGPSREKVAELCELLNKSDIFSLFFTENGEMSVGIKSSLRGMFNQLIVKNGFQKPLSKSNFSKEILIIDNIKVNITLLEISFEDKIIKINPCANLEDLIKQLHKVKL